MADPYKKGQDIASQGKPLPDLRNVSAAERQKIEAGHAAQMKAQNQKKG